MQSYHHQRNDMQSGSHRSQKKKRKNKGHFPFNVRDSITFRVLLKFLMRSHVLSLVCHKFQHLPPVADSIGVLRYIPCQADLIQFIRQRKPPQIVCLVYGREVQKS